MSTDEPTPTTNRRHLFAVWGNGAASAPLIREAEHSDRAWRLGLSDNNRCTATPEDAWWAIEVVATEADLDAATRLDEAVLGSARIPSRTAAKRQAHGESMMYRQGRGWVVSTWSDHYGCHETSHERPYQVAAQSLARWRRERAAELRGEEVRS